MKILFLVVFSPIAKSEPIGCCDLLPSATTTPPAATAAYAAGQTVRTIKEARQEADKMRQRAALQAVVQTGAGTASTCT